MKKLLFLLPLIVRLLISCQHSTLPAHIGNDPDYAKAKTLLDRKNDSAFYYFNRVAVAAKDSLQTAYAYTYMAFIQSGAGDYFGSQESLSLALKFLDPAKQKDRQCLSSTYNELGLISLDLRNHGAALGFFDQAIKFSQSEQYKLVFLNNKALAYQKKGSYAEALKLYRLIIAQTKNPETYARILSNMARTRWLNQSHYNAAPDLIKALKSRQAHNDRWGQNASYAHLADYYMASQPDSASFYADRMYAIARQLQSPDDQLQALQKLIRLSPEAKAKRYFMRYERLSDSLQTARNAAKNQFALIRYEVEKNKADNLKLQKDNTEKRYQLARQNILIWSAVFLFLAVIVMLSYRHRKKKQQAVQETQLRLTTKVHNRLANGIYQLIQEIDNHEGYNKEMVAQELTILYEHSRNLSHEPSHLSEIDFTEKIDRLLTAFAGPSINLAIVGNEIETWENIHETIKSELEQILQEWMVNMKKHSQATSVSVQFDRTGHQLKITYTDNGIGLPVKIANGKGLQFTGNRIKKLGGSINFDAISEKGTRITLTLPLT